MRVLAGAAGARYLRALAPTPSPAAPARAPGGASRPLLRRPALALALALASAPGSAPAGGGELELPAARVFPPGEAATPATLEVPLGRLLPPGAPAPGVLSLVVHKARRRLDLLAGGRIVKSYLVNLGLSPLGDKERRGDNRTPEGALYVCAKNAHSQFTRFLGLAYPSPRHVARSGGGPSLAREVGAAYRLRRACPPQGSALGGAVGIHGSGAWARTPAGYRLSDWTWGCVGLRDADIVELFDLVPVGTPVRILAD